MDRRVTPKTRGQVLATDDGRLEALLRSDEAPLRQIYADDYTLVTLARVIHTKSDQIYDLTSGRLRYKKIKVIERGSARLPRLRRLPPDQRPIACAGVRLSETSRAVSDRSRPGVLRA